MHGRKGWVIANVDVTTVNLGRMPTPEEVRQFNRRIWRLFRSIAKDLGFASRSWGVLWSDEFGGRNTNLHAHAVYAGPYIDQARLSQRWSDICAGGPFDESRIVSIKGARSFQAALAHALRYTSKYIPTSDAQRLASSPTEDPPWGAP